MDEPTDAGMSLQRHRASFRGTRLLCSLGSTPAPRTSAIGGPVRAPRVYVGMAPSGYTGGLVARVTRRALGISSVFLQGLQSSGLAMAPTPSLERDLGAVEDLGGCLMEYMAKVHALEQASQDLPLFVPRSQEHPRLYLSTAGPATPSEVKARGAISFCFTQRKGNP